MKKVKAFLRFAPSDIGKPITYHLVKDYDLWVNILHAEIAANKVGKLIVDTEGEESNIARAIEFLKSEGVEFQILDGSILWDEERCMHCGACTSVCPTSALTMNREEWNLVFDREKCFVCRLCVNACPVRAMKISI